MRPVLPRAALIGQHSTTCQSLAVEVRWLADRDDNPVLLRASARRLLSAAEEIERLTRKEETDDGLPD